MSGGLTGNEPNWMKDSPLTATKTSLRLTADPSRVLARQFVPGNPGQVKQIVRRVGSMRPSAVETTLREMKRSFGPRYKDIDRILQSHYESVAGGLDRNGSLTGDQKQLIGAYFTMEYSLESVALFNPSMVPHPDQTGLKPGEARFILSLRACGEGHISSIVFRSGVIHADLRISLDPVSRYVFTEKPVADKLYEKYPFFLKLIEMGAYDNHAQAILNRLGDTFTIAVLEEVIAALDAESGADPHFAESAEKLLWLAKSNYSLHFPSDIPLCERVIFPVTEHESRGIEDARFVRFTDEDGHRFYYATYTAYNGFTILPEIIETEDFQHFKIITLNGRCVQNKGMAMFPRRVRGEYLMLARLDGENLFLMNSDNRHFWNEATRLTWRRRPWEYVQVGNCGSPLETEAGWLVLTHGVGPMRQYAIGAVLLDLEDPTRVIGALPEPLLVPDDQERDGYVPNVVYSCGGMIHGETLILPYAVADTWSGVATVPLPELLARLGG